MEGVKKIVDLWTTIFLNLYNAYRNSGGVYFYLTIAIVVVYPITRRIVRAIRGGR